MTIEFNEEECPKLKWLMANVEEQIPVLEKLASFYQDFIGCKKDGELETRIKPSVYSELLEKLSDEDIIRKREEHLAALLALLSYLGRDVRDFLAYKEAEATVHFDETSLGSYVDVTRSYLVLENEELRKRGEATKDESKQA